MAIGGSGNVPSGSAFVDTTSTTSGVQADVDVSQVTAEAGVDANSEEAAADVYVKRSAAGLTGPSTDGEEPEDYAKVSGLFTDSGLPDPYNPNTTPGVEARAATDPAFQDALAMVKGRLDFNDPKVAQAFWQKLNQTTVCSNIMETLLVIMKESMKESNDDKRYYLVKMQQYNAIGEALSAEMHKLSSVMSTLRARGKDEDNEPTVNIGEIKLFSPKEVDAQGKPVTNAESYSGNKTQFQLSAISKDLEQRQEDLRNNRQMAQTSFQSADQRSNQIMNIMATVLKTMNEMRGASNRGLS